jgi:hypothetical protein
MHIQTVDADEPDAADLVAELDDEPEPGLPDEPDGDPPDVYTGTARGGPWDGLSVTSRFPRGFLLVNMPGRRVWVYDRTDDGAFQVRGDEPEALDEEGRWRAAEEPDYDILVPGMELGGDDA